MNDCIIEFAIEVCPSGVFDGIFEGGEEENDNDRDGIQGGIRDAEYAEYLGECQRLVYSERTGIVSLHQE